MQEYQRRFLCYPISLVVSHPLRSFSSAAPGLPSLLSLFLSSHFHLDGLQSDFGPHRSSPLHWNGSRQAPRPPRCQTQLPLLWFIFLVDCQQRLARLILFSSLTHFPSPGLQDTAVTCLFSCSLSHWPLLVSLFAGLSSSPWLLNVGFCGSSLLHLLFTISHCFHQPFPQWSPPGTLPSNWWADDSHIQLPLYSCPLSWTLNLFVRLST